MWFRVSSADVTTPFKAMEWIVAKMIVIVLQGLLKSYLELSFKLASNTPGEQVNMRGKVQQ